MAKIAIIGMGLIGTSLGLAIKQNLRSDLTVVGADRERENATKAQRMGAIDRAEGSAADAVKDAELVVVAAPIIAVRRVFEEIAPHLRPGATVTDTASVKGEIMKAARETLPAEVNFVGGHPMAGSDKSGPDAASADLFIDARGRPRTYCVVPSLDAHEQAISTVRGLAMLVGARPVHIDAEEHDALIAAVSHMPIVLSLGLFTMARSSPAWEDLSSLAGPAFTDLTRLAGGNPEMALDIISTNRENVLHWLDRLTAELARYRELLNGDEERPLHEVLLKAQIDREAFENQVPERREPAAPAQGGAGEQFLNILVGPRLMQRSRELADSIKTDPNEQRLRERELERAEDDGSGSTNGTGKA